MRIIIYLFILCAMPAMSFGQVQPEDLNSQECKALYDKGSGYGHDGMYQKQYDTLKKFVELCANVKVLTGKGEIAFNGLDGANGYRSNDENRHVEYREWIKSVLYLNLDTIYYCTAVSSIVTTLNYNPPVGRDYKAMEAVMRYVVDSGKCKLRFTDIQEILNEIHYYHHQLWQDTVQDSIATPFDTTGVPTIDDLGLSILRGPQNGVTPATHEPRLGELIATRNPFTDILELKYRLDKSAMVRINVYDLLGRAVYSEGQGYKAEGEHVLSLQSKGWASGSYYVRLSSPSGEVKTVKVVKE